MQATYPQHVRCLLAALSDCVCRRRLPPLPSLPSLPFPPLPSPPSHAVLYRIMHGANLFLEAQRWIKEHMPYWKRRGGRDHIWLTPSDEGACWLPTGV